MLINLNNTYLSTIYTVLTYIKIGPLLLKIVKVVLFLNIFYTKKGKKIRNLANKVETLKMLNNRGHTVNTKIWIVDNLVENISEDPKIIEASRLLSNRELVAFPTETVYGLGANALDSEAVKKIYIAKGRPSDNPLIVHISNKDDLEKYVEEIPKKSKILIDKFWPGPMTLVFKKKEGVFPDEITAGLDTVAIRMPSHPVALALIENSKVPIAAPSANLSGRPSPTTAKHVTEDLFGKVAGIVDGGKTGIGLESTVIDVTGEVPIILRLGGITKDQLEQCVGYVELDSGLISEKQTPRSPGMKYKHYAPKAQFILVQGKPEFLQKQIEKAKYEGKKVGVYTVDERKSYYHADIVIAGGSDSDLNTVAERMYSVLREFDHTDVNVIYGETFSVDGIGSAIMNRLLKAAGNHIITE
ncbi:MAG: Sua5/YciO/YrdC/YwlC family protein [Bacillales bacterium]|nr:Sua5/YciO/YrdC/YwlC family protein [Bacillales bacterium]